MLLDEYLREMREQYDVKVYYVGRTVLSLDTAVDFGGVEQ